jgi:hypothetical protein
MAEQTRTIRAESAERWLKALARAISSGVDPLTVAGSDAFVVESTSRPGVAYVIDATGTTCGCEAALAGDAICQHRAAVKFLLGELALPMVACSVCKGEGCLLVGWGTSSDVTACPDCDATGRVEQSLSSLAAEAPRRMAPRKERPAAERVSA